MVGIRGLVGLRPTTESARAVCAPPYDVIKEGSALAARLDATPHAITHVTLGESPSEALTRLQDQGALVSDEEPAYYVIEQRWRDAKGQPIRRVGVLLSVAVTDYAEGWVVRHEKTFDDKVAGRIARREATGHVMGPVFLLAKPNTPDGLVGYFAEAMEGIPLFDFVADFGPGTDLSGVHHRVWRIPAEDSDLDELLAAERTYIADGHHRYHAALRGGLSHTLAYVTDGAEIEAYNRVIRGRVPFLEARSALPLRPATTFATPAKHSFSIYTREGTYAMDAQDVPADVVGRLDCAILERELYPHLGLETQHIKDPAHFDYYPESALAEMKARVDDGTYELAVALHPVAIEELTAVADAGLTDSSIVMPQKSTFFSPKIPTGMFLARISDSES